MGFFPFPALSPEAGVSELAPTGTLHIPAAAEHPEEARLFLKFMAGPEAQELMKGTSLSPRNDLKPPKDPFLAAGYCLLSDAHDLSPFFDRACDPGISNAASEAMKAFMLQPEKENEIRAELEAIRAGFPP
ncbi:MAG: extracellular solute-binding protein, partial [Spirochaetales bacterium]|nr:extracellular solute-binding protein [Spirochaetales bacterium]